MENKNIVSVAEMFERIIKREREILEEERKERVRKVEKRCVTCTRACKWKKFFEENRDRSIKTLQYCPCF